MKAVPRQRTNREIFRDTIGHRPHEQFLFYAAFTPDLAGRLCRHHGLEADAPVAEVLGAEFRDWVVPLSPRERRPEEFASYFAGIEKPAGWWITSMGLLNVPSGFHHFTGKISPLRDITTFAEIKAFPFPPETGFAEAPLAAAVAAARGRDRVAVGAIGHLYENAWQIRGYAQFLADMIERPAWCEYILDRLNERNINRAVAAARAGVDMLHTGDDIASQKSLMFSPAMWRRFIGDRWARVYEAARRVNPDIAIWYHSDGNISDVIPQLIEIGVTVLNPLQPECLDVARLKREYGRDLVFDGTIGTQSTMPFASPAEVRRVVAENRRHLGADGALILSPTHILEPEVPLANVEAFLEACRA